VAELRAACPQDSARLAEIDAASNPSPWNAAAFEETLRRAHGLVVHDTGDCVTGFVVFTIVADECEVLGLAVEAQSRRRGLGRALLEAALERGAAGGAQRCFLEVRAANKPARALYAACGFAVDGRRKGYYRDGDGAREDALLLSRELGALPASS
jgi:ribosomal-protein-alanine N-acetyltransferase